MINRLPTVQILVVWKEELEAITVLLITAINSWPAKVGLTQQLKVKALHIDL